MSVATDSRSLSRHFEHALCLARPDGSSQDIFVERLYASPEHPSISTCSEQSATALMDSAALDTSVATVRNLFRAATGSLPTHLIRCSDFERQWYSEEDPQGCFVTSNGKIVNVMARQQASAKDQHPNARVVCLNDPLVCHAFGLCEQK